MQYIVATSHAFLEELGTTHVTASIVIRIAVTIYSNSIAYLISIVVCNAVTISMVVVPNAEHDRLPFPTLPLLPDTPRAPPTMDNDADDHSSGHSGDDGGDVGKCYILTFFER